MSQRINYMVLCSKDKARPISELYPSLELPSKCDSLLEGEDLFVVTEEGHEIVAVLLTEDYVLAEATEWVEAHGADRPDREALLKCDARYQVSASLSSFEVTFEAVWIVASRLAKTCDGVIFDTYSKEWVKPF